MPLTTSVLVMRGPLAVTVLLTTEVEAGLLEGVAEAAELIRGLLVVDGVVSVALVLSVLGADELVGVPV